MTQLHATLLIVGASIAHPRGQQAASICICIYVSKHHEPRFEERRHAHMNERLRAASQIACYAGNENAGAGNKCVLAGLGPIVANQRYRGATGVQHTHLQIILVIARFPRHVYINSGVSHYSRTQHLYF